LIDWMVGILPLVEAVTLIAVVGGAMALLDGAAAPRARGGGRRLVVELLFVGVALAAGRLLYWMVLHPSQDLATTLLRWDYLAFSILAGCLLRRVPFAARKWVMVALSVAFVGLYTGTKALALMLGGCLAGYGAQRWRPTRRPGVRIAVQTTLIVAVIAVFW